MSIEGQTYAQLLSFSKLLCYTAGYWPKYRISGHHRLIAEKLEQVEAGLIKRLIITMPPRHGKSYLASESFPAWYLGRNPEHYIIHATYAQELASDFGRKVRDRLESDFNRSIFPGVSVRQESRATHRLETNCNGSYFAVGVGGSLTGRGSHVLLIDDPIKNREEADSPVIREKIWSWYTSTAYTRLMPGGAVVIIQTRWHEDDLAGRLIKHEPEKWTILNLPALAEDNDPLGRKPGDALWPEFYPKNVLEDTRKTLGPYDWSALYQQRPTPKEGGIIHMSWFGKYKTPPAGATVISVDSGFKPKQTNDPSVIGAWRMSSKGHYLLDVWRERATYPALRRKALEIIDHWSPDSVLIEDKASGQSLIQDLLEDNPRMPVIGITPTEDKQSRAAAASGTIEAGLVYLPEEAPWLDVYLAEISAFPQVAHDDQVDMTSQYISWAARKAGNMVFDNDRIEAIKTSAVKNMLRAYKLQGVTYIADPLGPLKVWAEPSMSNGYCLAAVPRIANVGQHTAVVCTYPKMEQVAIWSCPGEIEAFAAGCILLAQRYGKAWIIPEREDLGQALVDALIRNKYYRVYAEVNIEQGVGSRNKTRKYGLRARRALTPLADRYATAVRDGSHGIIDLVTLRQLSAFRRVEGAVVLEIAAEVERAVGMMMIAEASKYLPKPRSAATTLTQQLGGVPQTKKPKQKGWGGYR